MSYFLFPINVFADDIGISDVVTYQVIEAGNNFDVNVFVTNNSSSNRNVDVNVQIFSPTGLLVGQETVSQNIPANSSEPIKVDFIWGTNLDTNYSVNSHILNVYLENDFTGASSNNNFYRKYFVISRPNQKIPVPDFPMIFSLLLMVTFVIMYGKKTKKQKKLKIKN